MHVKLNRTNAQQDKERGWKICSKCSEQKQLNEFRYRKDKGCYVCMCNKCLSKIHKEYKQRPIREPRKPKYKIDEEKGYKTCEWCDLQKPLSEFRFRLINNKYPTYLTQCKECEGEEAKDYKKEHIEQIRKRRNRLNRKYRQDLMVKLHEAIGGGMRASLGKVKDFRSWTTLVNFTIDELKSHLESNFQPGMTWENRGKFWHIDHILPKRLFKFNTPEDKEFKICWSLNNLYPEYTNVNVSVQDTLDNGKRARDLTEDERLAYIRSKGYDA